MAEDFETPFCDPEEAWFWFMTSVHARNDGARFSAGDGFYQRPCKPDDIMIILDRLYRDRSLTLDHLLVLRHYGRRRLPPDARRHKEIRAARLWAEAMQILEPVLRKKGIIRITA